MAIIKGSLGDIAKQSSQSIARSFVNAEMVALVDVSGSMRAMDARGGKQRYRVAIQELARIQENNPGEIAIISFSSSVTFCPSGKPLLMGGSTNLTAALKFAKVADVADMRFVLISDGYPDNPDSALAIASNYNADINVIYVGPENGSGRNYLEQLANKSGGQFVGGTVDLLEQSIQGLLTG